MVYQELGILAEDLVELPYVLTVKRASCYIAHSVETELFDPGGRAPADSPEVGERYMVPQLFFVRFFGKLCHPDAVVIGRNMLCYKAES